MLWVKQWRRCKAHVCVDRRPYSTMLGRLTFMPRLVPTDRVFRMRLRRLMKEAAK